MLMYILCIVWWLYSNAHVYIVSRMVVVQQCSCILCLIWWLYSNAHVHCTMPIRTSEIGHLTIFMIPLCGSKCCICSLNNPLNEDTSMKWISEMLSGCPDCSCTTVGI